ncbi:RpiB/LacA/LacB family sugar-phosphate isomerase [Stenotrophomonas maltophilia]|uniref:RpiB/LacA/LacB family sugar-phosphate isomerase n=1 Tax=Stenotrophomonas TaxID=40323 RepID=UPI00244CB808|nr:MULTISPECIES: RpiB/LacA/LacB family sugar-phosphate isomerase [Stenotrophomonas]MDH0072952.1 RpiB/LacA/LacB family sugar-phosphate isomerase [Stenotrophomonas maltophilia]MDH0105706.1 RpiB/LacA/LacB family sugar-phosphate isomerase [Stenotrophomonas maltophilia]MDH0331891.1 RpiB/LacA/LacB family sugar-phosphate isomerase [Stenotrophomonas maltophilia]MDH0633596.1 RpiB/LacA/LacB family sugar-phosphate isomerase [Stenotrophomonas maltophilia]MDH0642933.1 RpiB/LacA/LacB family sugar-phosphate 
MRIAVSADTLLGIAHKIPEWLRERGHTVILHGALAPEESVEWAAASVQAALDVAQGRADQAIVCCTTGTGATIAANKVHGVRAALCHDAYTAAGARRWNNANALGISLRMTSESQMKEMLEAWFQSENDGSQSVSLAQLDSLDEGRCM